MQTAALAMGVLIMSSGSPGSAKTVSRDAVVRWDASTICLQTRRISLTLSRTGGLVRTAWTDRETGDDLLGGRRQPDFALTVGGTRLDSADGGWAVSDPVVRKAKAGELECALTVTRPGITVVRHFVVYPGLALMRERTEIRNSGSSALTVSDPSLASARLQGAATARWMTGAEAWEKAWQLREEPLMPEGRKLDSYDAPHYEPVGDGTNARIEHNGSVVWPAEGGWERSAHSFDPKTHDIALEVRAGDRLAFVVARRGNQTCDTTTWAPTITYEGGAAHSAEQAFSSVQGAAGWRCEYRRDDGQVSELIYDPTEGAYGKRWRRRLGVTEPFIGTKDMHPDPEGQAMRVFVAPVDGRVRVTGVACNTGNAGPQPYGFRMGSQAYLPWICIEEPSGRRVAAGFDCIAHWQASARADDGGGSVTATLVETRHLAPGEVLATPTAFVSVTSGDLDEMGQEMLEWQYRYLWDYTRERWFPAVRLLGYWYKGTSWPTTYQTPANDAEAAYRKAFRTAELMREVGGDTYHRDWGWWDRTGDWNGPKFLDANRYLRRHDMGLLIYAPIYAAEAGSKVLKEHPDWLIQGAVLDQSRPEVVEHELSELNRFRKQWGSYQWRNDGVCLWPRDGDESRLVDQQHGFYEVMRRFVEGNPDCTMHGVNGGGFAINWEYLRYTSGFQYTDGQSAATANYYLGYIFPPDKINNMPDSWDPERFDAATWRGLLCANIDFTGDTFDDTKLDGIRLILDIYHYLGARGVVGRWVRIYHPHVKGADPVAVLQRLSWDRKRGVLITKTRLVGPVTLTPKGLLPDQEYEVSFQDDPKRYTKTGRELMAEGIPLSSPAPGEIVYLNLSDHPRHGVTRPAPLAPAWVRARRARHMGAPGTWACPAWRSAGHVRARRSGLAGTRSAGTAR